MSNFSIQAPDLGKLLADIREIDHLTETTSSIQQHYLWVLAGVGIPANILAIVGIFALGQVTPPGLLVLLLSSTDAMTLLLKLIFNQLIFRGYLIDKWFCRLEFAVIALGTLANWILVGISIDRFLVIRHRRTLRKAETCSVTESDGRVSYVNNKGILGAFCASLVFILLFYGSLFFSMRDVGSKTCTTYEEYSWFWIHVWMWINTCLYFFVPFVVILVFTVITVVWLLKDRGQARQMTNRRDQDSEDALVRLAEGNSSGRMDSNACVQDGDRERAVGHGENCSPTDVIQNDDEANINESDKQNAPISPVDINSCEKTPNIVSTNQESDIYSEDCQNTLTAMMILAATVFLLLVLPGCIYYLCDKRTDDTLTRLRWELFEQIQYVLIDSTHAVNFFLYFLAVKSFRDGLLRLLTCKSKDQAARGTNQGQTRSKSDNVTSV